ncbi:MAG: hypothetical protein J0626_02845 [Rhodospirillaceae bacterium]|nr:hypothetical protein [Rhodospirillaceae bacterium]
MALANDAADAGGTRNGEIGRPVQKARGEIRHVFPVGARWRVEVALLGKARMDEPHQIRHIADAGAADLKRWVLGGWQDRPGHKGII